MNFLQQISRALTPGSNSSKIQRQSTKQSQVNLLLNEQDDESGQVPRVRSKASRAMSLNELQSQPHPASAPKIKPVMKANVAVVDKQSSDSIIQLRRSEENLLEGGQVQVIKPITLPAKQSSSSSSSSQNQVKPSIDSVSSSINEAMFQKRLEEQRQQALWQVSKMSMGSQHLERAKTLVQSDNMVTFELGHNQSFDIQKELVLDYGDVKLLHLLESQDHQEFYLGQCLSPSAAKYNNILIPQNKVLVKMIIPKRNESTEMFRRRCLTELMILSQLSNTRSRYGSRVSKLIGCSDVAVTQDFFLMVTPIYVWQLIDFLQHRHQNYNALVARNPDCLFGYRTFILNAMLSSLSALEEIHKLGFVHNGINPFSFKVEMVSDLSQSQARGKSSSEQYRVVLCDFSLVEWKYASGNEATFQMPGTEQLLEQQPLYHVPYFAPEKFKAGNLFTNLSKNAPTHLIQIRDRAIQLDQKADLFSWASFCYYLLELEHPFCEDNQIEMESFFKLLIRNAIINGDISQWSGRAQQIIDLSDYDRSQNNCSFLLDLIESCWRVDPNQRADVSTTLQQLNQFCVRLNNPPRFTRMNAGSPSQQSSVLPNKQRQQRPQSFKERARRQLT
ncbi:hypothetical protein MP228_006423 [Amoeboaphelidium protococcarum]|nr:hypothetical protein MP228_006423 [Amoeboaphelidium protococcarum]